MPQIAPTGAGWSNLRHSRVSFGASELTRDAVVDCLLSVGTPSLRPHGGAVRLDDAGEHAEEVLGLIPEGGQRGVVCAE